MMFSMTTGTEADRKRLGALVKAGREAKGWTHTQAAAKTSEGGRRGINRSAWISVEAGNPSKPMTRRAIEFALDLEQGACDLVLAGSKQLTQKMRVTDVSGSMSDGVVALIASAEDLDDVSLRALLKVLTNEVERRSGKPDPGNGAHVQ